MNERQAVSCQSIGCGKTLEGGQRTHCDRHQDDAPLKMGEPCNGRLGRGEDGKLVMACSFCDRGTDGNTIAPNASVVCSSTCFTAYEMRRDLEAKKERYMKLRTAAIEVGDAFANREGNSLRDRQKLADLIIAIEATR